MGSSQISLFFGHIVRLIMDKHKIKYYKKFMCFIHAWSEGVPIFYKSLMPHYPFSKHLSELGPYTVILPTHISNIIVNVPLIHGHTLNPNLQMVGAPSNQRFKYSHLMVLAPSCTGLVSENHCVKCGPLEIPEGKTPNSGPLINGFPNINPSCSPYGEDFETVM